MPTHPPSRDCKSASAYNLSTLIDQEAFPKCPKTLTVCLIRNLDGSVPSFDMILKHGILPGKLTVD